jgi:hypothetical protein
VKAGGFVFISFVDAVGIVGVVGKEALMAEIGHKQQIPV